MDPAQRPPVFVVERDPHVRRLVRQFLSETHSVELFDDGYVALDRIRLAPPAALVTEILVPQLDGLALCRLLKNDQATRHVPILVFSVLAAGDRAKQAGADAFFLKPLEKLRFATAVSSLTGKPMRGGAPTVPPGDAQ